MTSASDITSLRSLSRTFFSFWSPRVMAVGLATMIGARVLVALGITESVSALAGFGVWDLLAIAIVICATPLVEWAIHLLILHRKPFFVGSREIDISAPHRQHHQAPGSLDSVLLRGEFAFGAQLANAMLAIIVVGPVLWLVGQRSYQDLAGPLMTAVVMALAGLFHYEWAHLMFHTGYRPRSRYYRRLKRNHRLHHYRNENYWLGITSNAGDRILSTYPASRSAVGASPTVRTLGVDSVGVDSVAVEA